MRILKSALAGAALSGMASLASAQEIACDTTYTVVAGDSLSAIAERAYDNARAYQIIFDLNPGKLKSPNLLSVGVDLYIPCRGDQQPAATTEAAASTDDAAADPTAEQIEATVDEVVTSATEPDDEPVAPIEMASTTETIRILTGSDYAPYVGDDLPNGGFSTELVERALLFGAQPANYRIDVISDWGAHLSPLLEDGAYDLGYPWFQPNCDEYSKLGPSSQWRCDNLLFSQPLHEIVVTFYGRRGDADSIRQPEDAFGLTICRPDGYFTHDLEAMGLVEPQITRVAPNTPNDCFEMLRDGTADLVSVNADTSDRTIRNLGMQDQVIEVIDLSTIQTLHVVGMRGNPATRIHMRRLDRGLRDIHQTGQFRAIAAQHL